ncbi:PREDICTED: uncharacterized protein LOC107184058 isoform X2 [Myotis davidii]|uniref:uncharacterized protein LOC107184058 isoform X2 n=1 Tax=Myotis davidii TaxID=225400 RepID=UPI000767A1DD|nr:PREDICTED: uncharacterized protein LOC107184058 isoform X2 [Myotis davidii]
MWKARPREGQRLAVATGMWVAFCAPSGACLLGTSSGFDVSPATAALLQPVQGSLWLGLTGLGAGPGELCAPHLRTPGSCWRLTGRSEGGPAPERPMKNQTDAVAPGRRGRVGPSCGAQKEHSILVSIAALGRALRGAVAGDPRGALERAAWTVALRTEAVMRRHCRPLRQSRRGWWARPRPQRHRGRRRRLLLRALDAVATCWEKLFALRALDSRGP